MGGFWSGLGNGLLDVVRLPADIVIMPIQAGLNAGGVRANLYNRPYGFGWTKSATLEAYNAANYNRNFKSQMGDAIKGAPATGVNAALLGLPSTAVTACQTGPFSEETRESLGGNAAAALFLGRPYIRTARANGIGGIPFFRKTPPPLEWKPPTPEQWNPLPPGIDGIDVGKWTWNSSPGKGVDAGAKAHIGILRSPDGMPDFLATMKLYQAIGIGLGEEGIPYKTVNGKSLGWIIDPKEAGTQVHKGLTIWPRVEDVSDPAAFMAKLHAIAGNASEGIPPGYGILHPPGEYVAPPKIGQNSVISFRKADAARGAANGGFDLPTLQAFQEALGIKKACVPPPEAGGR